MTDIRILEVITPSNIGGAEVYLANLCAYLPGLGAKIRLFCPSGREFARFAADRGLDTVSWRTHGKVDPLSLLNLTKLIRRDKIDVVHTHLSTASLIGSLAARMTGRPSVAHVHGLNTATCFRHATAIVAVSDAVKSHLCGQGIDERRVQVVHNGIDLSRFKPTDMDNARTSLGLPVGIPLFGVLGRLSIEKGQRTALDAMALLTRNLPDAVLLLVGRGDDEAHLRERAESLGVAKNVVFAGFQPDVRQYLCACDAAIVPSTREGLGLAALEAMALQRPVIASAVGGLIEIVVDGQTGLTVPPDDPERLANAMAALAGDRSIREMMGSAGRARVERYFDFRKQSQMLLEVIRSRVKRL